MSHSSTIQIAEGLLRIANAILAGQELMIESDLNLTLEDISKVAETEIEKSSEEEFDLSEISELVEQLSDIQEEESELEVKEEELEEQEIELEEQELEILKELEQKTSSSNEKTAKEKFECIECLSKFKSKKGAHTVHNCPKCGSFLFPVF